MGNSKYEITRIKGGTDNCYLISDGKNALLFDTSSGESKDKVMEACSKYEMKALVLSHPHFDHAENAAAISEQFKIPVAYHKADDEIFDNYDAQPLRSYGLVGFVVLKMSLKVLRNTKVNRPGNCFYIKEGDTFADYGFPDVRVIELPGHTKGSIGLLVQDHSILVGDALDNWITPGVGHLYYDLDVQKKTAEKIRSFGKRTIYYGHGKPTGKSE
ncbi:MAG: MBL fold metallo-hydrolase [Lachnospiraceae bacterium]|nr:MBL fold metallo-hydrolase [Lachnospiraceae bacterium]